MTKQYFAARYFNAAYYMDWLGTFDESIGYPLWDTSQGMARSNIKFTPIVDVSVRVSATKTVIVSTTGLRAWGSAVVKAQSHGANAGCRGTKTGVRANAYSRSQKHGGFISARWGHSSADAAAPAHRCAVPVGFVGASVSTGVSVVAAAARMECVAWEKLVALGINNPSDEEMAALAFMLVTKRTTKRVELRRHL